MEGDPTEAEEDEQVGKVWEHFSEHIVLKMAAAKVISKAPNALHVSFWFTLLLHHIVPAKCSGTNLANLHINTTYSKKQCCCKIKKLSISKV